MAPGRIGRRSIEALHSRLKMTIWLSTAWRWVARSLSREPPGWRGCQTPTRTTHGLVRRWRRGIANVVTDWPWLTLVPILLLAALAPGRGGVCLAIYASARPRWRTSAALAQPVVSWIRAGLDRSAFLGMPQQITMASLVQAFNLAARLEPTTRRLSGSCHLAPRELADRAFSAAAGCDLWSSTGRSGAWNLVKRRD